MRFVVTIERTMKFQDPSVGVVPCFLLFQFFFGQNKIIFYFSRSELFFIFIVVPIGAFLVIFFCVRHITGRNLSVAISDFLSRRSLFFYTVIVLLIFSFSIVYIAFFFMFKFSTGFDFSILMIIFIKILVSLWCSWFDWNKSFDLHDESFREFHQSREYDAH
jgi:hypothetical protein